MIKFDKLICIQKVQMICTFCILYGPIVIDKKTSFDNVKTAMNVIITYTITMYK